MIRWCIMPLLIMRKMEGKGIILTSVRKLERESYVLLAFDISFTARI